MSSAIQNTPSLVVVLSTVTIRRLGDGLRGIVVVSFGVLDGRLAAAFPALHWAQVDQLGSSECGSGFPGLGTDGEARTLPNWSALVTIPAARWVQAVAIAEQAARSYGFDSGPVTPGDDPATHFVAFDDLYRTELTFTVGKHTGLLLVTGCHLTAAVKLRGRPGP
jgi:hypothetical protein